MAKNTKLELTWIGKDKRPRLEPRVLIEDPTKSYHADVRHGPDDIFDNMLIHGDNLLALKALEQQFSGQVKCIYIDPPYNTGNAFEHYDDGLEHSIWLGLMRERLVVLRDLLATEGSIWIQIDDEEQAYLKVLCDEVFGRENFVNMISVNMKNVAGVAGGGEDKRIKKNCEYILVYARNYDAMPLFNGPYQYTEMDVLVQQYKEIGKSWKYTTVLTNVGTKEYIGSTVDGDGNEIKVFTRKGVEMLSVSKVAERDDISESEVYKRYAKLIFQTTNAQSSIRTRVMDFRVEKNISEDVLSIEYVPKTGKNKGTVYEQFYKGDKCRLFVWLKDTAVEIKGVLYKKDLQGTYWDMTGWMKNLTKEGGVEFPEGKKPEELVRRILSMTTEPGDLVCDSFLGSGTTAATAHKMGRRWIGIELRNQCYSHCIPRLVRVVDGTDDGGVTEDENWHGGGGYRFYELAPTLIKEDAFGQKVINKEYNAEMLAEAVCKLEGFTYAPSETEYFIHGHSTERDFIYVTTNTLTPEHLIALNERVGSERSLLVCCKAFTKGSAKIPNLTVKKIPKAVLDKCEYGHDDYSLNVKNLPMAERPLEQGELFD